MLRAAGAYAAVPDVTGDLEILAGVDDEDGGLAPSGISVGLLPGFIAEASSPIRGTRGPHSIGAQPRGRFARPTGEHQAVHPIHGCAHGGHSGLDPVHVDLVGEPGVLVPGVHGRHHAPQIPRAPASPARPDSCSRASSTHRPTGPVMLHPQDQTGIDAARACGHHQALHRGEPHGGVDRAAEGHRSQGGTGTEVGGDQAKLFMRSAENLTGPSAGPGVAEAVKAEASNAPLLPPRPGMA